MMSGIVRWDSLRTAWLTAAVAANCLIGPSVAVAQRDGFPRNPTAEAVFLDTDSVAARKLSAARDLLSVRQWGDAIELIRQIAEQHGERLVAVEPGRYITVDRYCSILLSSMPSAGLKMLREQLDPQARRWFEAARATRDERALSKIVCNAFLSSYGDDAAFLLGELAWERGAIPQARAYWQSLAPPENAPYRELFYPDSDLPQSDIQARLIVCDLAQGKRTSAERRRDEFRARFPGAEGRLAGRNGPLALLLQEAFAHVSPGEIPPGRSETLAFAGNNHRNHSASKALDVGAQQWSVPLREPAPERRRAAEDFERLLLGTQTDFSPDAPAWFPVVRGNAVFLCDETAIYAYDLRAADPGGKPLWGDDPRQAAIFRLPPEKIRPIGSYRPRVGSPQYTLTVNGDHLYARLGSPTAGTNGQRALRGTSSFLVRLDLRREGDLAWPLIDAEQLEPDAIWAFEGAPLVADGRVYVALRRRSPQPQCNVACFDAETAQLLWNRKVCVGLDMLGGDVDEVQHQLLTLAEDRIYHVTNLGAVASLDAHDGTVRWATTYPHLEPESLAAASRRHRFGPNPGVYHDGMLFVAPTDSDRVLALEAGTGAVVWEQELPGTGRALLGVAHDRLIVAGRSLLALDAATGARSWRVGGNELRGMTDPESASCGRGIIAGGLVYWPRREDLLMVDVVTGRRERVVPLYQQHGVHGGNLTITSDFLLIAQQNRLSVFSQFGGLRKETRPSVAAATRVVRQ